MHDSKATALGFAMVALVFGAIAAFVAGALFARVLVLVGVSAFTVSLVLGAAVVCAPPVAFAICWGRRREDWGGARIARLAVRGTIAWSAVVSAVAMFVLPGGEALRAVISDRVAGSTSVPAASSLLAAPSAMPSSSVSRAVASKDPIPRDPQALTVVVTNKIGEQPIREHRPTVGYGAAFASDSGLVLAFSDAPLVASPVGIDVVGVPQLSLTVFVLASDVLTGRVTAVVPLTTTSNPAGASLSGGALVTVEPVAAVAGARVKGTIRADVTKEGRDAKAHLDVTGSFDVPLLGRKDLAEVIRDWKNPPPPSGGPFRGRYGGAGGTFVAKSAILDIDGDKTLGTEQLSVKIYGAPSTCAERPRYAYFVTRLGFPRFAELEKAIGLRVLAEGELDLDAPRYRAQHEAGWLRLDAIDRRAGIVRGGAQLWTLPAVDLLRGGEWGRTPKDMTTAAEAGGEFEARICDNRR